MYFAIQEAILEEAQRRSLKILSCTQDAGDDVPEPILSWQIGASILVDEAPQNTRDALEQRGIPFVVVNPMVEQEQDCIVMDDIPAMTTALEYLHDQGCDSIINAMPGTRHPGYCKRNQAYRNFTDAKGLPPIIIPENYWTVVERVTELASSGKQIGVLTESDWYLRIQTALRLAGNDRSIVLPIVTTSLGWVKPHLALEFPWRQVAEHAITMVQEKWDSNGTALQSRTVMPQLKIPDDPNAGFRDTSVR